MGFEGFQPSHWYLSDLQGHALSVALVLLIFLSFLLFASLLFRLVCYRETHFAAATATSSTIAQHTIAVPAPSLGLDATTINSLPMFIHRSSDHPDDDDDDVDNNINSFKQGECPICLGFYEDKEMVKVMPVCLHAFHSDCVDEWLRSRSTCPLCRLSLDSLLNQPWHDSRSHIDLET